MEREERTHTLSPCLDFRPTRSPMRPQDKQNECRKAAMNETQCFVHAQEATTSYIAETPRSRTTCKNTSSKVRPATAPQFLGGEIGQKNQATPNGINAQNAPRPELTRISGRRGPENLYFIPMAAHAFPAGGVGGKRVGRAHLDQPSACGTHHAAVLLGPTKTPF